MSICSNRELSVLFLAIVIEKVLVISATLLILSLPSASESKIDVYMILSTILCIYEYYFKNICMKNDISFFSDFKADAS